MSLIQILMRRAVPTMAVCLCAALALWRAQSDTDREARGSAHMAQLVAALVTVDAIAQALCLSPKTVANYQTVIRHKLGLATPVELVRLAQQYGLASR